MTELGPDPQPSTSVEPPLPQHPGPLLKDRSRALGALLCLAAAVLTAIGALQPFITVRVWVGEAQRFTLTITPWGQTYENAGPMVVPEEGDAPLHGVPLLVGAALLLTAAVLLAFAAARPAAAGRPGPAGALTAAVAAAFVVATAANIALQVQWWAGTFQGPSGSGAEIGSESTQGPGLWTVLLAAALAVGAAVVAWRARPQPAEPEREEPETPRLGIPVLVHRLPDAPPDEPGQR